MEALWGTAEVAVLLLQSPLIQFLILVGVLVAVGVAARTAHDRWRQ